MIDYYCKIGYLKHSFSVFSAMFVIFDLQDILIYIIACMCGDN